MITEWLHTLQAAGWVYWGFWVVGIGGLLALRALWGCHQAPRTLRLPARYRGLNVPVVLVWGGLLFFWVVVLIAAVRGS